MENPPKPPISSSTRDELKSRRSTSASFLSWVLRSYGNHTILVVVCLVLTAVIAGGYTYFSYQRSYTASVQVLIRSTQGNETANIGLMNTLRDVYESNDVLVSANTKNGNKYSLKRLADSTTCSNSSGSLIMTCQIVLNNQEDASAYIRSITHYGKLLAEREFANVKIGNMTARPVVTTDSPYYVRNIGSSELIVVVLLAICIPFLPIKARKPSKHQSRATKH